MESSLACLNVFYLSSLIRPYVDTDNIFMALLVK